MHLKERRTSVSRLAIRIVANPDSARYEHVATLKGQLDSYPVGIYGAADGNYALSTLKSAIAIAEKHESPKPKIERSYPTQLERRPRLRFF